MADPAFTPDFCVMARTADTKRRLAVGASLLGLGALAMVAFGGSTVQAQDYSLTPNYGSYNLNAGFSPDPFNVSLSSGGNVNAGSTIGGSCAGMVSNAPDLRVNYSARGFPLTFRVYSGADTTLLINAPDGRWYCDDDGGGNLDPRLRWSNPPSGQYDIWVGSFGGGYHDATLSITELE